MLPRFRGIPVQYAIVDYASNAQAKAMLGVLSGVRFAVGVTKAGYHSFLFMDGDAYEVHWAVIPEELRAYRTAYRKQQGGIEFRGETNPLYEASGLAAWLGRWVGCCGVLFVPPYDARLKTSVFDKLRKL